MAKFAHDRGRFLPPAIQRAKKLAWLLDEAFTVPVIRKRIGLDPIVSAIPGGGDALMLLFSCYILWVAWDLKLPHDKLVRMAVNIGIDYLVGLVPVAGDLLDFAWKANTMNVEMLEAWYLEGERRPYQPSVVDISTAEA